MNKLKLFVLLVAFGGLFLSNAYAEDLKKACIKYQRADYKVYGSSVQGHEINAYARANGYKSDYNDYSTYFIVTFDAGGYVALDVGSYLPSYETEVSDQAGMKWKIKSGWYNCD